MKFVHWISLKPGAKKAVKRGPGKYRKYVVDQVGRVMYIASLKNGRPENWLLIAGYHKGD